MAKIEGFHSKTLFSEGKVTMLAKIAMTSSVGEIGLMSFKCNMFECIVQIYRDLGIYAIDSYTGEAVVEMK